MKFTEAKSVRIEDVMVVNVGENLVGEEAFKDFTEGLEQGDGMVGRGIRFTFTRLSDANDFSSFSEGGKMRM